MSVWGNSRHVFAPYSLVSFPTLPQIGFFFVAFRISYLYHNYFFLYSAPIWADWTLFSTAMYSGIGYFRYCLCPKAK